MSIITIQAISGGQIIDERTATTPAGARRSLLAMIDRTKPTSWADDCMTMLIEGTASNWDGRSDFREHLPSWNQTGGITFWAQA